jgi:hypothetical protein
MINKSLFKKSLLIIAAINLLSFLAYNSQVINWLSFIFILMITALIAWRNLFYGVLILLGELMISSQGHLFDLKIYSFVFSLRMGIFAVILIVALVQFLIFDFKFLIKSQYLISNIQYFIKEYKFYILLALFVVWGIVNGLLNNNSLNFLYQDANGYLFFLLLPVFILAFKEKKATSYKLPARKASLAKAGGQATSLVSIWAAAIAWQFIISVSLLFLYGHLDIFWRGMVLLYAWFRDQRIIEVGLYKYNFYRVFMQSQIYTLTGLFIFLSTWVFVSKKNNRSKFLISNFKFLNNFQFSNFPISFTLVGIIVVLIISLSRSFWLAGFITFAAFIIFYLYSQRPKIKILFYQSTHFLFIILIALMIVAMVLLAPIGKVPGFKTLSSLPERAAKTEEPALNSRWELLPVLWRNIRTSFLFGNGFGSTVTYKTSDPRYLEAHPDNPYYTTFAFEWGWLDIWYKIGLLGLLTYLLVIGSVLYRISNFKFQISNLHIGLFFGLIALVIVNFFTPFLNHPLGISYLLLTDAVLRTNKTIPTLC